MLGWLVALMTFLQLLVGSATAGVPSVAEVPAISGGATVQRPAPARPGPASTPSTPAPRVTAAPSPARTSSKEAVLSVTRTDGAIDVRLTGRPLARAWRVDLAASSDPSRRLELLVETSDVGYLGGLTVYAGSSVVRHFTLTETFRYCDGALGACVSSNGIRTPAGDSVLGLHVTIPAATSRTFAVRGAVREATAPFVFGPWREAAAQTR